MGGHRTVLDRGGVDGFAVVILPGDGVAVLSRGERSGVGGFAGDGGKVSADRVIVGTVGPAGEGVGVLGGGCLLCILVGGHRTVLDRGSVDEGAVVVQPGDGVGILRRGVGGLVGGVAGDGGQGRRPAGEGVGEFGGGSLCCIGVGGHHAVLDRGGVNEGAVVILPGDGVGILRRGVGGLVGGFAGDGGKVGADRVIVGAVGPAGEGVGVFVIGGLGGRFVGIGGRLAVFHFGFLKNVIVVIDEGDGILVEGGGIGGRVFRIAFDGGELRRPACKFVGVLGIGGLGGFLFGVFGHLVVFRFDGLQDGHAVLVIEGDGVFVRGPQSGDFDVLRGHDGGNLGLPACEGVALPLGRRRRCHRFVFSQHDGLNGGAACGIERDVIQGLFVGLFIDPFTDLSLLEQGDLVVPNRPGVGGGEDKLRKLPLVFLVLFLFDLVDQIQHQVQIKDAFLLHLGAEPGISQQLHQHEPGEGIFVQGDLFIVERGFNGAGLHQREAAHALAALHAELADQGAGSVEADDGAVAGEEVAELGGDPAAGAPDAGDHGAGADLQGLAAGQRRRHVEEELAGNKLHFQLAPGFLDGDGGILIQLDGLGVIQADVGIAAVPGGDGVAAVKAHILDDGLGHTGSVLDGHGALGLHKAHSRGLGLACGVGGYRQPQHQDDGQDQCNDLFHAFASQALLSLNRFRTFPSRLPSSTMLCRMPRAFSAGMGSL